MSCRDYEKILRKAEKSLLAAKKLLEENLPEFAVSRAYYTMFYCVEAFLRTRGIEVSKHSSAIALFGRDFVKTGEVPRKYLTYVNLAFRARQVADYSFGLEVSEEEAAEEIRRAEEFLEFTRRYLSSKGFLEG
ncbi:DNA-binding protein [Thermococcus guaymasensis DSM 11113]|uniref:DNA-binding protein n=1 Tax=Thermococcus guaymasensis DSM 11113 TaxID=1432656 RepID=A0A0X1KJG6_9EURY|nr:HEPN domain-containing protein [Thermococcus guaymasensis]AJC71372.1 DNA-binding protein [Thermococcus guaymasensis DSM 11113]